MPFNPRQKNEKYVVGDIVDMAGQPNYVENSTGKWMIANGSFVAGNLLSSTLKNALAADGTSPKVSMSSYGNLMGATQALTTSQFACGPVGGVQAVQCQTAGSTAEALIFDASGVTKVQPVVSGAISTGGQNIHSLTSNGSAFFDFYHNASGVLKCRTSTDGKAWSDLSLTGLPSTYTSPTDGWNVGNSVVNTAYNSGGLFYGAAGSSLAFWCGARFLYITGNATNANVVASTSADGISWGGDQSVAVLGSASIAMSTNALSFVYKNGNTVFLLYQTGVQRVTTDGGVTWSTPTGLNATQGSTSRIQINATAPAKLTIYNSANGLIYYTANGGATWVSRALPAGFGYGNTCSFAYAGSTVLLTQSSTSGTGNMLYRSTDDGASWSNVTMPAGASGNAQFAWHDGYRFLVALYGVYQMLTSTDGINFSVRALPKQFAYDSSDTYVSRPFAVDANKTIIGTWTNTSNGLYTIDGGVTWKYGQISTTTAYATGYPVTINTAGFTGVVMGGAHASSGSTATQYMVSVADLAGGGAFFKTATINPLRTGATPYVKVA